MGRLFSSGFNFTAFISVSFDTCCFVLFFGIFFVNVQHFDGVACLASLWYRHWELYFDECSEIDANQSWLRLDNGVECTIIIASCSILSLLSQITLTLASVRLLWASIWSLQSEVKFWNKNLIVCLITISNYIGNSLKNNKPFFCTEIQWKYGVKSYIASERIEKKHEVNCCFSFCKMGYLYRSNNNISPIYERADLNCWTRHKFINMTERSIDGSQNYGVSKKNTGEKNEAWKSKNVLNPYSIKFRSCCALYRCNVRCFFLFSRWSSAAAMHTQIPCQRRKLHEKKNNRQTDKKKLRLLHSNWQFLSIQIDKLSS